MANLHTVAVAAELASRPVVETPVLKPGTYTSAIAIVGSDGTVQSLANGPSTTTNTASGGTGTVVTLPGGVMIQAGKSAAAATGGPSATVAVVFPTPFVNPPIVVCGPDNRADGTGNFPFTCIPSSITNTGFLANFNCEVQIGGGGAAAINNVVHCDWQAIGK